MEGDILDTGILPFQVNPTEVYPFILRCAILSENSDKKISELNNKRNSQHSSFENSQDYSQSCPPKYVDKLLEQLVKLLKKQLAQPDRYPAINGFRHPQHRTFWLCLNQFATFLNSIPKDKVGQRIGNIEALVMIFSKYASQRNSQDGGNNNEVMNKFSGLLRQLLYSEFNSHPAYSVTIHRLNSCIQTFQESHYSSNSDTFVLLKKFFNYSDSENSKLMSSLRSVCNDFAAFQDTKKCLNHLELGLPPYPSSEDFLLPKAFETWKLTERSTLSQLITSISLSNPEVVSLSQDTTSFSVADHNKKPFIFIPKEPRDSYRLLLSRCVLHDFVSEGQEGGRTFSTPCHQLLNDCALRWRLTSTFKLLANLEIITYFYGLGKLDFDYLVESFINLQKHITQLPCDQWSRADRNYLYKIFLFLLDKFLIALCEGLEELASFPTPVGLAIIGTIDYIFDSFVFKEAKIERSSYVEDLSNKIQGILVQRYEILNDTAAPEAGESEALNLRLMAKLITKDINLILKLFPKLLLDAIDVPAILIKYELRYFTLQAENMLNGRESDLIPVEEAFDFYNSVLHLYNLAKSHVPDLNMDINLVHWFNRQFTKWLSALDNVALGWVELAIKYDKFTEISDSSLHSSSVDDLICCFREQLDFLDKLQWPNDLLESRSMAKVAKVIYESVELYAKQMATLFTDGLVPKVKEVASKRMTWDLLNFNAKKKSEEVGEMTQQKCIFINNIYHLRRRLQELFKNLDYQRYSQVLAEYTKEKESDQPVSRMFYIKVVCAELLKECDSGKDNDAYVVLSMNDEILFTTSVQWDNALPRWNETVGVAVESVQELKVQAFDKDILSDDLCGDSILVLDPKGDWSSEDANIWLQLEPQGRILFSISTADEKDDPYYYVSKATRLLEMQERDLLQHILSRYASQVKTSLSRKVILTNHSKRKQGGFRKFLGSAAPSELEVTEEEVDKALAPLADYLDGNLNLPYSFLYEACGCRLVLSVWKECLQNIEMALIPPFSSNKAIPKPLSNSEFDCFKMVTELLKLYFHGGSDGDGLPLPMLEIPNYRLILSIANFYFKSTEDLIQEYLAAVKDSATHPRGQQVHSPKTYIVLRLIRMKGEKSGVQFVNSQLEMRAKQMAWAHSQALTQERRRQSGEQGRSSGEKARRSGELTRKSGERARVSPPVNR